MWSALHPDPALPSVNQAQDIFPDHFGPSSLLVGGSLVHRTVISIGQPCRHLLGNTHFVVAFSFRVCHRWPC